MEFKSSLLKHKLFLLFVIVNLTACGGGGSDSIPASKAPDTDKPFVIATIPTSEQFNTGSNDLISVNL